MGISQRQSASWLSRAPREPNAHSRSCVPLARRVRSTTRVSHMGAKQLRRRQTGKLPFVRCYRIAVEQYYPIVRKIWVVRPVLPADHTIYSASQNIIDTKNRKHSGRYETGSSTIYPPHSMYHLPPSLSPDMLLLTRPTGPALRLGVPIPIGQISCARWPTVPDADAQCPYKRMLSSRAI